MEENLEIDRRKNLKEREMFDKAKNRKIFAISQLLSFNNEVTLKQDYFLISVPTTNSIGQTTFKMVSLLRGHQEEFENKLNVKITFKKDGMICFVRQ